MMATRSTKLMRFTLVIGVLILIADRVNGISNKEKAEMEETGKAYRAFCESEPDKCAHADASAKKEALIKDLIESGAEQAYVDEVCEKTYEAKKAIFSAYGLDDMDPGDDCIWEQDEMLSPEEAQDVIDYYTILEEDVQAPPPLEKMQGVENSKGEPQTKGKKKRNKRSIVKKRGTNIHKIKKRLAGINFAEKPPLRWPRTIPYYKNPNLDAADTATVQAAIKAIEGNSCLRFTPISDPSSQTTPYLNFVPKDSLPDMCGVVYQHGYQRQPVKHDVNFVDNSMGGGCRPNGTLIHETLHQLGIDHEQMRPDRATYLKVTCSDPNWERQWTPTMDDSTYETNYDFYSIMHYGISSSGACTAEVVPGQEVDLSRVGQRVAPSGVDWAGLNKAYKCDGPEPDRGPCEDKSDMCAQIAAQNGCGYAYSKPKLDTNVDCIKSCGYCSAPAPVPEDGGAAAEPTACVDENANCEDYKSKYPLCTDPGMTAYAKGCKKTCNACDSAVVSPAACTDKSEMCAQVAAQGMCGADSITIQTVNEETGEAVGSETLTKWDCQKSCGVCSAPALAEEAEGGESEGESGPPEGEDICYDYYLECPQWQHQYYMCQDEEYQYMVPFCTMTCGLC